MLARHPRIGTPCSLLGSSTALALASARPRAQPSTCRPQLRTFSAHSPTQKPLAGAAPIAVELNERTVTVQLHGGHTTSLSVHAPLLPVLPPPPETFRAELTSSCRRHGLPPATMSGYEIIAETLGHTTPRRASVWSTRQRSVAPSRLRPRRSRDLHAPRARLRPDLAARQPTRPPTDDPPRLYSPHNEKHRFRQASSLTPSVQPKLAWSSAVRHRHCSPAGAPQLTLIRDLDFSHRAGDRGGLGVR